MKKILILSFIACISELSPAQWEPDLRLTNDPSTSINAGTGGHSIACAGDTIHVVWCDDRDGNLEIYYKRSVDAGTTWGADTRLTTTPLSSINAVIALSGPLVHVAWNDLSDGNFEIYYKRSADGGESWEPDVRITNTPGVTSGNSLATGGSMLYLVYHDECDGWWEVYFKRSTDRGVTWEPEVRLTYAEGLSANPTICADGPAVHVAWDDERVNGDRKIFYTHSQDSGSSWEEDICLVDSEVKAFSPGIATSGGDVYLVWEDWRNWESEIYFKHSDDGGIGWGDDIRLTNYYDDSKFPNLAVSGDGIFVVWMDHRLGNPEIFCKHSADKGLNWDPDKRLTSAPEESTFPFVAVSGQQVNVTWYDFRDGNYEIYYKRDPTGNLVTGVPEKSSYPGITIYPNPAGSQLTVDGGQLTVFSRQSSVGSQYVDTIKRITIFDSQGRILKEFGDIPALPFVISIHDLNAGIYFIHMYFVDGTNWSEKFIKIK